jgi:hypothetical protein
VLAIPLRSVRFDPLAREVPRERLNLSLLGGKLEFHGAECSVVSVRRAAALLAVLALAGCGGSKIQRPEEVVRAWSLALNRSADDEAAALFATEAEIVQGGLTATLRTRAEAEAFNRSLPCAGRITKLETRDEFVTATFALGQRPGHQCDAPGARATAVFRVRGGKIVLWHQLGSEPASPVA